MSKPFQISIRWMLCAIALFCLTLRLLGLFLVSRYDPSIYTPIQFFGCFAAGGATVGCAEGRPFRGALVGLLVAFLFGIAMSILVGSPNAARE